MNSKLQKDISELVDQQVISQEIATSIEDYYNSKERIPSQKLFTVFGVLGSLLVGLGIILILAHNWDHFSKPLKTFLAFLPLIIGQLVVGFSIIKEKSTTWKEASGTYLFFAIGACIALISQIYNIPGDLSSYLLTWIFLCVPLIYLLKSNALTLLIVVFSTFYACEYGYFSRGNQEPWMYLLMMVSVIPFYYKLLKENPKGNITSIFNWLFPLSLTIVLGSFVATGAQFGFLMYISLFALFYNIGKLPFFSNQKLRQNGYVIIGSLGTVFTLLILSFRQVWNFSLKTSVFQLQEFYIAMALFLITLVLISYMNKLKWIKEFNLFQYVFIIYALLFVIGFFNDIIPTVIINLLVLALGLTTVKIGIAKYHFGVLNYGLLIITALIICRFFDTDMSFVIRGLLFVCVGVGFFITNYIMLKKQNPKN